MIFIIITANAQWQSCSIGGLCVTTIDTNVFLSSGIYGVMLSTDNGNSWTPVNNGLPIDSNITSLTSNGANIFAGTFSGDLFVSANNGGQWSLISNGLPDYPITSIAVLGSKILVGMAYGNGLYFSDNIGASWIQANNGLPSNSYLCKKMKLHTFVKI